MLHINHSDYNKNPLVHCLLKTYKEHKERRPYHLKHGIIREMLQSKLSLTSVTGISLSQHSLSISRHNLPTMFRIQFLITNESHVELL